MTEPVRKRNRLSYEILGLFAICFAVTVLLYLFLSSFGVAVIEAYCWDHDIPLDEEQLYHLDGAVFSVSLVVSVAFFIVLFLILFGERLGYIRTIIKGVETLRGGESGYRLPIEGNNELTQLAEAINYLSETEAAVKEKERALNEEREELIRTLSHDIRTPLTSILSYTELLDAKESCTAEEQREYLSLVRKKAGQIKSLTDILLDGGKRSVEFFEDARLLIEQLAFEFEEGLEDGFRTSVDLSGCSAFRGHFDVQEMRRIFDNLASNVRKYADPTEAVELTVTGSNDGIVIRQKNAIAKDTRQSESYRMGLYSIRRIAYHYSGGVELRQDDATFEITITLSDL